MSTRPRVRGFRSVAERLFGIVLLVVLSPAILLALALYFLYSLALYLLVTALWLPRGKDMLFVYSNSPNWQDYIEANLLPAVRDRSVVLNWSERSQWRKSHGFLAVACFHHFGAQRDFNPMAVVFRRFRRAKVFRFFRAFKDWKHGNGAALEYLQQEMFEYLRKES
jgi:hypothetical protein